MPTPDEDGISITKNKLWSSNAGRMASGKFAGDIIAVKLTIDIVYTRNLKSAEIAKIDQAIHQSAFMNVKVPKIGEENSYITARCYVADVQYPIRRKTKDTYYGGLSISFVEQ